MISRLQKIISSYERFTRNRTSQKAISWLFFIWLSFVLFLYLNNSEFLYILASLSLIMFLLLLFAGLIFGIRQTLSLARLQTFFHKLSQRDEISLSLPNLISLLALGSLLITNAILFTVVIYHDLAAVMDGAGMLSLGSLSWLFGMLFAGSLFFVAKKRFKHTNSQKIGLMIIICFSLFAFLAASIARFLPADCPIATILIDGFVYNETVIIFRIFTVLSLYALLTLLFYISGRAVLGCFRFKFETQNESFLFSLAVGIIPILLGTFILVMAGYLYAWAVVGLVLVMLVLSRSSIKQEILGLDRIGFGFNLCQPQAVFRLLLLTALCLILIVNFISIFKPAPIDFDSLTAYFNTPNLFVSNHGYTITPSKTGNMGQYTEMLYTFTLSFLSPAYIVHFSFYFFLLCLMTAYALMKKLFGQNHALLGIFVFMFVPWNFIYMNMGKVEFMLSFYLLLSVYAAYYWYQNNKYGYLYLAGVFSGLAVGIKYNAALLLVPLYLGLVFIALSRTRRYGAKPLYSLCLSILFALLLFSPWILKNKIYFHNSFYPYNLGFNLGVESSPDEDRAFMEQRYDEIQRMKTSRAQSDNSFAIALVKTVWSKSIKQFYTDAHLDFGILPLVLLPFALFFLNDRRFLGGLFLIVFYFLLWYASGLHQSWYAFFGFMLVSLLVPRLLLFDRKSLYTYIVFMAVVVANYALIIQPSGILYLGGFISTDAYLDYNVEHYNIAKTINRLDLGDEDRIYMPADSRVAFIENNDRLMITDLYYTQFGSWYHQGGQDNVSDKLRQSDVRYILYCKTWHEKFLKWLNAGGLTPEEYLSTYTSDIQSVLDDEVFLTAFLEDRCELVTEDENYAFYKLKTN